MSRQGNITWGICVMLLSAIIFYTADTKEICQPLAGLIVFIVGFAVASLSYLGTERSQYQNRG